MTDSKLGYVTHDASDLVVLRCVDRSDADFAQARSVVFGDDSADDDGGIDTHRFEMVKHMGYEIEVLTRQNRQTDHIRILIASRRGDLFRSEANAGVDDLHARVARCDRNLLGAI